MTDALMVLLFGLPLGGVLIGYRLGLGDRDAAWWNTYLEQRDLEREEPDDAST